MIDCENEIYTPIARALRVAYPGINVSGEYVRSPSSFPHASIVEADNYVSEDKVDSSGIEQYATLMYEVNVYSNKVGGKKTECKKILDTIDRMMFERNFRRIARTPVPNLEDASIYRITARYRAETDGTYLYRN